KDAKLDLLRAVPVIGGEISRDVHDVAAASQQEPTEVGLGRPKGNGRKPGARLRNEADAHMAGPDHSGIGNSMARQRQQRSRMTRSKRTGRLERLAEREGGALGRKRRVDLQALLVSQPRDGLCRLLL